MRRIKQIAIVLALVMGMSGQTIAIGAEEVNQNTQVEQEENQDQAKEQTQQENITVPVGLQYGEEISEEAVAFQTTIEALQTTSEVSFKVPYIGQLQLKVSANNGTEAITQAIVLHLKEQTSQEEIKTITLTPEQLTNTVMIPIKKAGNYTMTAETAQTNRPISIEGNAVLYRGDTERTLSNRVSACTYTTEAGKTVLYKIKIPKNGRIVIHGKVFEDKTMNVEILNSKKVSLNPKKSTLSASNEYSTYYALKKGAYYIRVKDMNSCYRIRYRFYSYASQAGTSKAKAVSLTKKKTKKGILYLTDSTSKENWFKVTLSKKQKLSMIITSYNSEKLQYQLVSANSQVTIRNSKFYPPNGVVRMKTGDMLPKGTYYIKVSKTTTKNASGAYSIMIE